MRESCANSCRCRAPHATAVCQPMTQESTRDTRVVSRLNPKQGGWRVSLWTLAASLAVAYVMAGTAAPFFPGLGDDLLWNLRLCLWCFGSGFRAPRTLKTPAPQPKPPPGPECCRGFGTVHWLLARCWVFMEVLFCIAQYVAAVLSVRWCVLTGGPRKLARGA